MLLHVADSGAAELLILLGADTSVQDRTGATPLHYMAAKGQTKTVEKHAQQESSAPNMINKKQQTHWQFACQNGHTEMVAALLRIRAFAAIVDADGGRQFASRETLTAYTSRHDSKPRVSGVHVGFSRRRTATSQPRDLLPRLLTLYKPKRVIGYVLILGLADFPLQGESSTLPICLTKSGTCLTFLRLDDH